jgi:hypothetical protein
MKRSQTLIKAFVIVIVLMLVLSTVIMVFYQSAEPGDFNSMAPYLQNLSASSVTVCFFTNVSETGSVYFSENMSFGNVISEYSNKTFHEIQITGLAPNTTYNYYAKTPTTQSGVSSFRTAPSGNSAFRFAVYGDTRSNTAENDKVLSQMHLCDPEFIVNTGDEVNSGSNAADWAVFFNVISKYSNDTCYWPSIGNHDTPAGPDSNYRRYFNLPGNERWYSFDYANSHFVVLDTESPYENGTEQNDWLKADLREANQYKWTFVMFHRPPYSSGGGHGSDLDVRAALDYIFVENNVTAVFNSHDHIYEHADPGNSVQYFVTGGGGAPLYSAGTSWFTVKSASVHHFLILDVTEEKVTITCITDEGAIIDTVEITK